MRSTITIRPNCSFLIYTAFIFVLTFTLFGAACNNSNKETARMQSSHAPSDGPDFTGNPHPHQTGNPVSGKEVYRFETFGNEGFWTDAARLPKGMTDAKFTPKMALEAGLQIDIEAVEPALRKTLESEFKTDLAMQNAPMLNDPKTMVALVNANVGTIPKDSNNDKKLDIMAGDKVGISCTICHTITDKAVFDAAIEMLSKSEIQRRKAIVQEIAQRKRAEAEAEMLLLPTLVSSSFKRISIPEIFGRADLR